MAKALGGIDVSMLIGLVVSSVVYLLVCRGMDLEADRRQAAEADLGLDPDAEPVASQA